MHNQSDTRPQLKKTVAAVKVTKPTMEIVTNMETASHLNQNSNTIKVATGPIKQ